MKDHCAWRQLRKGPWWERAGVRANQHPPPRHRRTPPFVLPDPDPVPTVGRGTGAAPANHHHAEPPGTPTLPRLPRLRSGTSPHRRSTPIVVPGTPGTHLSVRAPLVGARWGGARPERGNTRLTVRPDNTTRGPAGDARGDNRETHGNVNQLTGSRSVATIRNNHLARCQARGDVAQWLERALHKR